MMTRREMGRIPSYFLHTLRRPKAIPAGWEAGHSAHRFAWYHPTGAVGVQRSRDPSCDGWVVCDNTGCCIMDPMQGYTPGKAVKLALLAAGRKVANG